MHACDRRKATTFLMSNAWCSRSKEVCCLHCRLNWLRFDAIHWTFFFFREMKMFQSAKYFCFQLKSIRIDTRSERRPYNSILKFKVKEVGSVIGQTAWIFFSMNCFAIFLCTPANRHCASFSTQSWTLFSSFNEKLLLLSCFFLCFGHLPRNNSKEFHVEN